MNKEKEEFSFHLHKIYDVSDLKKYILTYSDEKWLADKSRQEQTKHHTKTQTCFISQFELIDDFSNYIPKINEEVDQHLVELIMPIINDMQNIYNGKFGRILLIKLPSGESITPHIDKDNYFNIARRFHVPVVTSAMVEFYVDNDKINMKEGECWEINNKKIHSVSNCGLIDRIHLLFDIIPNI